jgi:hypothetical protein
MRRRYFYALTAGVLSSGAPAGLLGIRLVRRDKDKSLHRMRSEIAADRAAYIYIGAATAVIFALFGYVLGRHADELADLSETDALTQLLNARGFSSRLRAEIRRAKRYREPLSVLFLDVDSLKRINDRHGHRAGSDALRQVASVIRAELRATLRGEGLPTKISEACVELCLPTQGLRVECYAGGDGTGTLNRGGVDNLNLAGVLEPARQSQVHE